MQAARAIVKTLRKYSADKIEIIYQDDFPKSSGKEWRKLISEAIKKSNWFILLLPDPSEDWDWCLFETGLFEAQRQSGDRLICLHHPQTEVPDQINIYQAISAEVPKVKAFLETMFIDEGPIPGMKAINTAIEDDIDDIANQIVSAILPKKTKYYRQIFEPWISIKAPPKENGSHDSHIDNIVIDDSNPEALELFEFIRQPATWGELQSGLSVENDGRWREEFSAAIKRVGDGRKWSPVQSVFQAQSGKIYRPTIHGVDRLGGRDGPIVNYHITFTEEVLGVDTSVMPENLLKLGTVLRFAFRFRWEILEKFTKQPLTEADVERVENAFARMQAEWESRGGVQRDDLFDIFPKGEARDRFEEMSKNYALLRNPEKTGGLDIAIEKKDADKVQELLITLLPVNQEFLELATDAFAELVHKY